MALDYKNVTVVAKVRRSALTNTEVLFMFCMEDLLGAWRNDSSAKHSVTEE